MMDDCNFETTWEADGQRMANSICQGDNFAIVIDDPFGGEQYFLVLCDNPLFTCKENFQDGWGNDWEAGDWLLQGYWYHKRRRTLKLLCCWIPPHLHFATLIWCFVPSLPCPWQPTNAKVPFQLIFWNAR